MERARIYFFTCYITGSLIVNLRLVQSHRSEILSWVHIQSAWGKERGKVVKYQSLQVKLDILGQVKYTVIYRGYGDTVLMLLLARLDFRETRNVRLSPLTAILLLPEDTVAALCGLF